MVTLPVNSERCKPGDNQAHNLRLLFFPNCSINFQLLSILENYCWLVENSISNLKKKRTKEKQSSLLVACKKNIDNSIFPYKDLVNKLKIYEG